MVKLHEALQKYLFKIIKIINENPTTILNS